MATTKEDILHTALKLFAKDGYEAVSVSMIAGELGITKGALYRHYESKRDILDHIVLRMQDRDSEQATAYNVPDGDMDACRGEYEKTSPEDFIEYCMAMYVYWTEDEFAADFRKLLTIEQFRSEEMQRLYQQYLVSGPLCYVQDIFKSMGVDAWELKATELYSLMFFYYSMYDGSMDKEGVKQNLLNALMNMKKELIPGYLDGVSGEYATPKGYFVDEALADEYDKTFYYKEKKKLPGQIF